MASEVTVLQGDCIERMAEMEEASVDAVVCDPPYGIGFMGHEWDQPGEFGPVDPDEDVPLQGGKKRRRQPSPASGAGHTRERRAKRDGVRLGGPTGADNTTHTERGGAMHAGRYDLSLTANQRYQAWCEAWARECLRILKPGGHLLASCGTRTYHRLAAGVEDAGFEIRDSIMWIYGSGFPKSLDVSKAIDKAAGAEREDRGPSSRAKQQTAKMGTAALGDFAGEPRLTAPATPEAEQWQGWGTALKPAHEPIVVARKPLTGTVAANVLEHGTGGVNVDGCRVEGPKPDTVRGAGGQNGRYGPINAQGAIPDDGKGRWPANVVLDPDTAAELDAQTGDVRSAGEYQKGARGGGDKSGAASIPIDGLTSATYADSGGASRFFYCAKTSRAERNAGLGAFPDVEGGFRSETSGQHLTRRDDGGDPGPTKNGHPTVKPISLMRWLVRLVTPPDGLILDPFLGSGTTGCAAALEDFDFIGIEREAEYVAIAEARMKWWAEHRGKEADAVLAETAKSERASREHRDAGQMGLEID